MAVNLSPVAGVAGQLFDNNGDPLTGGKVFTYAAGTTTNQTTFTNASGSVPHSNPIILDAAGRVPGGEIWLTDGSVYKFVITDSSNVLIGTYDNIIGINSNFVNFTNSQEIQTATAGQTVFTLTTTDYQPGTNSLSVFVDGVNQYGPGAQYAYLETNSTTVTFITGLHVGAEVKFTTSQLNSTAGNDATLVSYVPPFVGSVGTNVAAKLAQTVSVKDFGAVGDGVADDTVAIQAALNNTAKQTVFMPSGTYKITDELVISGASLLGDGVVYVSPYISSAISGTVIQPVGMQNKAAISITTITANNGVSAGGFGIDMTSMTAGTLSGDFDITGMTKGVFIENRHNTALHDIEVFAVPANAAAFVMHSVQPGGGMYWGKHDRLASRTKLAVGNEPSAKGFVLLGTGDEITAQIFTDCTSYRGWYLKNANSCQFVACHSENAPKDSVYIDSGSQLTFIGGFYENQGTEDAARTYYQFYGLNNPKRVSLIGLSISGNGINGLSANNGFARINSGGAYADERTQILGNLVNDDIGNVGAPNNTSCLGYASAFNSTVPTATEQKIYFNTATAGYDIASEYNAGSGNYAFRRPSGTGGFLVGSYLVTINLAVVKSGGGAIPSGTILEFRLGGAQYIGATPILAVSVGTNVVYLTGSTLVRVNGTATPFMEFKFYHNAGSDLVISNNNGAVSPSWFNVCKVA